MKGLIQYIQESYPSDQKYCYELANQFIKMIEKTASKHYITVHFIIDLPQKLAWIDDEKLKSGEKSIPFGGRAMVWHFPPMDDTLKKSVNDQLTKLYRDFAVKNPNIGSKRQYLGIYKEYKTMIDHSWHQSVESTNLYRISLVGDYDAPLIKIQSEDDIKLCEALFEDVFKILGKVRKDLIKAKKANK